MGDDVLVTGATGFIGQHLVAALTTAGASVRTHSRQHGDIASMPLEFEDVRHVFHLAARTFVPDSWKMPREFYETNVLGTVNVLEFCRRTKAALTFLSSYVYGAPQTLPIAETHPLQAYNPYSHTKIVAEDAVRFYAKTFGVTATIVRPFNVYGPGQSEPFLIPGVIRKVLDPTLEATTVTDLRPRRDYIFIADLVALLMRTREVAGGGTYNAGSGDSYSVQTIVETVGKVTGIHKPIRSTEQRRENEILDVVADMTHATSALQWQPTTTLRDGLRQTIAWVQTTIEARR